MRHPVCGQNLWKKMVSEYGVKRVGLDRSEDSVSGGDGNKDSI